MTKISREIKAVTLFASAYRDPDDEDALLTDKVEEEDDDDDVSGPTGLFSFDAWNRKNPLIYKPNVKRRSSSTKDDISSGRIPYAIPYMATVKTSSLPFGA